MFNSALIKPRSIAVVGASSSSDKPGGRLVVNLQKGGYGGKIYPVNPREQVIHGLTCYNTLELLPETDMAILALSPPQCVEALEAMATTKKTKAFIIISAGFGETDDEGKALEKRLKELAGQYELDIIGPNCMGLLNEHYKSIFVSALPEMKEGCVDFVSASGALVVFFFELAPKLGIRFGSVYSVGNSVTIGVEEVLEYWDESYEEGRSGRVKLVYVEQIRKPQLFFEHAWNLRKKGCQVVVLKPGESEAGARAALSHTGSMAGDREAYDYLFRKAGAIRCYSREEFAYLANILVQPEMKGKNLVLITHAGGPAVLVGDELQRVGLEVPELNPESRGEILEKLHPGSSAVNPIDMLATGNREQLSYAIRYADKLDYIDGIIVMWGKTGLDDLFDTYTALHEAILECKKPVYPVLPCISSGEKEIAHFLKLGNVAYPDEVMLASCLGKVYHRPDIFGSEIYVPPEVNDKTEQRILPEEEVLERLHALKIPHVETLFIRHREELDTLKGIRYPVAAKVTGILHKTEHGGVILDIRDQDELEAAFSQLTALKSSTGILVQEMVRGTELYLGAKKHDGIGWSVHAGPGGIFVELLNDRVSALAPLTLSEARQLLDGVKTQQLFRGFRNYAPVNKEAFARLLTDFSQLFSRYPDISEIDLNPLIASGDKILVVDARMITERIHKMPDHE